FKLSQRDDDVQVSKSETRSDDDVAARVIASLVNQYLLDLANSLHHRLLRRLGGNTPKIFRRYFPFHNVADVRVRFYFSCSVDGNFVLRIRDPFRDDQARQSSDFAGLRVNINAQFPGGTDALLRCREKRV